MRKIKKNAKTKARAEMAVLVRGIFHQGCQASIRGRDTVKAIDHSREKEGQAKVEGEKGGGRALMVNHYLHHQFALGGWEKIVSNRIRQKRTKSAGGEKLQVSPCFQFWRNASRAGEIGGQ